MEINLIPYCLFYCLFALEFALALALAVYVLLLLRLLLRLNCKLGYGWDFDDDYEGYIILRVTTTTCDTEYRKNSCLEHDVECLPHT
jgi:hypothetical protein